MNKVLTEKERQVIVAWLGGLEKASKAFSESPVIDRKERAYQEGTSEAYGYIRGLAERGEDLISGTKDYMDDVETLWKEAHMGDDYRRCSGRVYATKQVYDTLTCNPNAAGRIYRSPEELPAVLDQMQIADYLGIGRTAVGAWIKEMGVQEIKGMTAKYNKRDVIKAMGAEKTVDLEVKPFTAYERRRMENAMKKKDQIIRGFNEAMDGIDRALRKAKSQSYYCGAELLEEKL